VPSRAKLRGDGEYSWADAVKPQPKTENRMERERRLEKRLAYRHYDKPPHGGSGISWPCGECAAGVRWFTYSVSDYWQPFRGRVPRGFTR